MRKCLAIAVLLSLVVSGRANAGLIYQIDRTIGEGSVTGFITTDGTQAEIMGDNIVDWALTILAPNINDGVATNLSSADRDALVSTTGAPLFIASTTDLFFDFSDTRRTGDNLFFVNTGNFAGGTQSNDYWCVEITQCTSTQLVRGESLGQNDDGGVAQTASRSGLVSIASRAEDSVSVAGPATLALLGLGLAGMGFARRRKAA